MHNVLSQIVPIFPLYILLKGQIGMFEWEGIDTFWTGGIGTVWHRKSKTKNLQHLERFFELYQLFRFSAKLIQNPHFTYYPNYLLLD